MASANGAGEAVEVETQQQVDPMVEADQKYAESCAFLNAEEYDKAIASLSRALKLRVEKFGEQSPQCGSAYIKYGSALLQKARSEGDVLDEKAVELSEAEEEAAQMPCVRLSATGIGTGNSLHPLVMNAGMIEVGEEEVGSLT